MKSNIYTVVAILDRSTPDPDPHPGFFLLATFWISRTRIFFLNETQF